MLRRLPILVALAALVALFIAGPGYRLDLWDFSTGFQVMRWAAIGGLVAAGLALLFLLIPSVRRSGPMLLGAALLLGLTTAWIPWQGLQSARSVPPIHDITTDTVNPPEFVDVLPLRADAPNPPEYPGEETAEQQREAYPSVRPLRASGTPGEVFRSALAAAEAMGWEIIAAQAEEGRIEATDTTFWFGFRDDVVIRLTADNGETIVDVRSKSRIGRSDVGANARRIETYLERLEAGL